MKQIARSLPLLLVLGFCLLMPAGAAARLLSNAVDGWMRNVEQPALVGMVAVPERPAVSLQTFVSGELFRYLDRRISAAVPFRPNLIRANNELLYQVFGRSYMYESSIVIGRDQQLFERTYLDHYCNREGPVPAQSGRSEHTAMLSEISAALLARGQTFVYLITPSKAAYLPDKMPAGFPCATMAPRAEYRQAVEEMRQSGINFVDGSSIVLAAHGTYPGPLFARGGTHWTRLGALLAAKSLLETISTDRGSQLPEIEFETRVNSQPSGTDIDLLSVLNLQGQHADYEVIEPIIASSGTAQSQALDVAFVGGSFVSQVVSALTDTAIFGGIDYFYYFSLGHSSSDGGSHPPADPADPATFSALLEADIVVLEENEALIGSTHARLLWEALQQAGK